MHFTKSIGFLALLYALAFPGVILAAEEGSEQPALETETSADEAEEQLAGDEEQVEGFAPEQLEELLAPVALYPDALLAQVMMAATYPLDIVQAARWLPENSDLEGEALSALGFDSLVTRAQREVAAATAATATATAID